MRRAAGERPSPETPEARRGADRTAAGPTAGSGQPGHRWRRHRGFVAGLALVGLFVLASALAPVLAPADPLHVPTGAEAATLLPPGPHHALGTDVLGRDLLSRVLYARSEEHTSELQSRGHLVCRLLLEKKKNNKHNSPHFVRSKQKLSCQLLRRVTALHHTPHELEYSRQSNPRQDNKLQPRRPQPIPIS